jgi:hypothetical protein
LFVRRGDERLLDVGCDPCAVLIKETTACGQPGKVE